MMTYTFYLFVCVRECVRIHTRISYKSYTSASFIISIATNNGREHGEGKKNGRTDRQTDRQIEREIEREIERKGDRKKEKQMDIP